MRRVRSCVRTEMALADWRASDGHMDPGELPTTPSWDRQGRPKKGLVSTWREGGSILWTPLAHPRAYRGGAADPWNSWTRMTVLIDGEPWFVAKDVCEVVGIAKHRDAISDLDDDERVSVKVDTLLHRARGEHEFHQGNEHNSYPFCAAAHDVHGRWGSVSLSHCPATPHARWDHGLCTPPPGGQPGADHRLDRTVQATGSGDGSE